MGKEVLALPQGIPVPLALLRALQVQNLQARQIPLGLQVRQGLLPVILKSSNKEIGARYENKTNRSPWNRSE